MSYLKAINRTDYEVRRNDIENGIIILANIDKDEGNPIYPVETYDFKKFCDLKQLDFDVVIDNDEALEAYILHSDEIWLPILYFIGQVGLGVLVSLITDYIKFKFSSLGTSRDRVVHFKIVKKLSNGEMKEISYDGPESAIEDNFKDFDFNKFMED